MGHDAHRRGRTGGGKIYENYLSPLAELKKS